MNGPQRTACLAKGYNNDKYNRSIGYGQKPIKAMSCQTIHMEFRPWQYAILILAGSKNLCQTIISNPDPLHNHPGLAEIPAYVGSQEVASHTHKILMLMIPH